MCRLLWLSLLAMVTSTHPGSLAAEPASPADLILTGGTVYTMNPEQPQAEAVAVKQDRIVYVGSAPGAAAFRGTGTRLLDLHGQSVLPGLIDAHAHLLSLGRSLSELDLTGTTSPQQICQMVQEKQKQAKPGAWISGRGWDQNDWEAKEFPTWEALAGTETNPVYLRRVDGHAVWVNRKALEICGISRETPDPAGGRIIRDAEGLPTGVLVDNAADLVRQQMPQPTLADRLSWAKAAMQECHRVGLVGIHDAGVDSATLTVYRELEKKAELTLRIYAMIEASDSALLEEWMQRSPDPGDGRLMIRAVKLYADGALGSRGAALLDPYTDDPTNSGLLVNTPEYLYQTSLRAVQAGFQVCTHAIGDRANRVVLDTYEKVLQAIPAGDYRLRLEHAQVIAPEDFPRLVPGSIIASMQPTHATSDMPWAQERLGPVRVRGAYAWRSVLNQGCHLALGSDFPVELPNPVYGIYAAVTRQDQSGQPPGGWYPEQRLTLTEAVRGFTLEAAYAQFAETQRGSIEVGKLADFTVLDRDLFQLSSEEIFKAKVTYTIIGGKVVYQAP